MSDKKAAKKEPRMRREYGIGCFLDHIHGLRKAAKKIQKEEQLMLAYDPKGKIVQ